MKDRKKRKAIKVPLVITGIEQVEKQVDIVIQKLKKANALADTLAVKINEL